MFSVIFPGQGSQLVGMGKEFYDKYDFVKKLFKEADEILQSPLSKLILEGPKEELDLTVNTQPAIFLISYSIFNIVKNEFNIDLSKAKYFAGHSLGEYSALCSAGYLNFEDTIKILKIRGDAMQNAVPKGEGGMVAVLGSTVEVIEKIIKDNEKEFYIQIPNDNSEKIESVKEFFNQTGASKATQEAIEAYTMKAFETLTKMQIGEDKKMVLRAFGEKLMNRDV